MVPAARPAASCPNPNTRAIGDAGTATVRFSTFFFFSALIVTVWDGSDAGAEAAAWTEPPSLAVLTSASAWAVVLTLLGPAAVFDAAADVGGFVGGSVDCG